MSRTTSQTKALAVDLIGTLVARGEQCFTGLAREYLGEALQIQMTEAEVYAAYRKRYLEYSLGNYASDEEFIECTFPAIPSDALPRATTELMRMLFSCISPFDDAERFLANAAPKYTLILASNYVESWAMRVLSDHGWSAYFTRLVVSSKCGHRKPARGYFDVLSATSGAGPGEVVMIGDSYANDVIGATHAGMKVIQIVRDGPLPVAADDSNTWAVVRSLKEVMNLIDT